MALYNHNCSLFSCVDDGNALIYEKMPSCAAFGCSNKREAGFRMFRFPREQARRAMRKYCVTGGNPRFTRVCVRYAVVYSIFSFKL